MSSACSGVPPNVQQHPNAFPCTTASCSPSMNCEISSGSSAMGTRSCLKRGSEWNRIKGNAKLLNPYGRWLDGEYIVAAARIEWTMLHMAVRIYVIIVSRLCCRLFQLARNLTGPLMLVGLMRGQFRNYNRRSDPRNASFGLFEVLFD